MAKMLRNPLYKLQRKAAKFCYDLGVGALFMEQGTGKTITILAVVARLLRRNSIRYVLVLTPKSVIPGWDKQINDHLNIGTTTYQGKKGFAQFEKHGYGYNGIVFLVINHEYIARRVKTLAETPWDVIICDESQRIKSPTSSQSKAARKLAENIEYKYILSGTPTDGDEMHLWAQFKFLGVMGDQEWYWFSKSKCYGSGFGGYKKKLKVRHQKWYRDIVAKYSIRITKKEMLDLPPTVDQAIYFELTGQAKKAYANMEKAFYTEFEGYETTNESMVTNMIRLSQLAGGHLATDTDEMIQFEQDKLFATLDYIRDFPKDKKIVIFVRFREEIDLLSEGLTMLGRTHDILDGRQKNKGIWLDFQDGKFSDIICQSKSGGVGIELFASSTCIFYSSTYSYIDYAQARDRLDRNGQEESVNYIHLLGVNTIDIDQHNVLQDKGNQSDNIFRQMKRRMKDGEEKRGEGKRQSKSRAKKIQPSRSRKTSTRRTRAGK